MYVKILQCELLPLGMCISLGCGREELIFPSYTLKGLNNVVVLQCVGCKDNRADVRDQHREPVIQRSRILTSAQIQLQENNGSARGRGGGKKLLAHWCPLKWPEPPKVMDTSSFYL